MASRTKNIGKTEKEDGKEKKEHYDFMTLWIHLAYKESLEDWCVEWFGMTAGFLLCQFISSLYSVFGQMNVQELTAMTVDFPSRIVCVLCVVLFFIFFYAVCFPCFRFCLF